MTQLVRYLNGTAARWGVLDPHDHTVRAIEGSVYADWRPGDIAGSTDGLTLLPPCEPTIVAALAYNYKDLVGPRPVYDEPLVFLKSPTCVVGAQSPIRRPSWVERLWVEVEVAIVLRSALFNATVEEAAGAILGWTIGNDVTAMNVHDRDHHLARSKSLDTFCPVGPVLHTDVDTRALALTTRINGRITQQGTTRDRILGDAESLMLVSRLMRLQPGDIVLTGTPAGAMDSLVTPGDDVHLEIQSLGSLHNPIEVRD